MTSGLAFQIAFAVAVVAVAGSLFVAGRERASARSLEIVAGLMAAGAVAAWVVFALDPGAGLGVAAAGLAVCAVAELLARRLRPSIARGRQIEAELEVAKASLAEVIEREAASRAAELERTLARARADSVSLLAEEERRIAEERRRAVVEREEEASSRLAAALASTQERVERRLGEWNRDLDRAQQAFATQVARLGERQRQLLAEAQTRVAANAERLEAESEEQRAALLRLRQEVARAAQEAVTAATGELEAAAIERRRALEELGDRLRKREQALGEQIEREEAEAVRRIQAGFADVERRQVEQLERVVARAASSFSDATAQQFADSIKSAREDAARRLSRELDRAVQSFAREASSVLAERLAHVGDAGAQRVEKRLSQTMAGIERQRDEFVAAFEQRVGETEDEYRRRFDRLIADLEAERGVLRERLEEVARRMDEVVAQANERLAALQGLRI
jgi:localization factor PodJL